MGKSLASRRRRPQRLRSPEPARPARRLTRSRASLRGRHVHGRRCRSSLTKTSVTCSHAVIVPYPAWRACHMLARLASPLPRQLLQAFPSQPLPRRLSDRLFVSTLFPRLG
ncbi:hypothetical protein IG631_12080 [Alternaria alternata]|nr:hypothetical protein IG631_12080 [Alternaria alternata]